MNIEVGIKTRVFADPFDLHSLSNYARITNRRIYRRLFRFGMSMVSTLNLRPYAEQKMSWNVYY